VGFAAAPVNARSAAIAAPDPPRAGHRRRVAGARGAGRRRACSSSWVAGCGPHQPRVPRPV